MSMFHIQLCINILESLSASPKGAPAPKKGTFDFRSAKQHPSSWQLKINIHTPCRFARYTVQTNIFLLYDRTSSNQQLHSLQWQTECKLQCLEETSKRNHCNTLHLSLTSPGSKVQGLENTEKKTAKSPPTLVGCMASPLRPVRFFPKILEHLVPALTSSWFMAHQMAWLVSANLSSLRSDTAEN